ncbi:MFS transporter [Pectinatus haikarae]|uniref:MFS transporter n=1 Tax=Pectinatus haikarae TaxID=349096 RepID=UPI001E656988|nr:MFS transporter [Pectinatus haikarae]
MVQKMTNYRWVVLTVIFIAYTINFADRSNIGIALPFISEEFHITNFEAGAVASMFFFGYAVSQIPAGYLFTKMSLRGLVSISIIGFSIITFLIGTASSASMLKWLRFGLGLTEGPCPVGLTSTINNWFPAKEKATAVGVYIASTMFAPIIVPPLCVWLATTYGWRSMFIVCAVPGFIMAAVWYWLIRERPEQSESVNQAELDYIREKNIDENNQKIENVFKSMGPLDRLIRVKEVVKLEKRLDVFKSWNIWGDTLAYFMMVSVLYGLMTWIPTYLVKEAGYSFTKMGFVAAAPWIGGLIGAISGGYISDKIFKKRRKPTMLITAISTVIMMIIMLNIPNSVMAVALSLFATGLLLNVGWPAFTAYPMGLTNQKIYPLAISVVNTGGNLGGFFAPMIAGALLDMYGNFNTVFMYFGVAALIGFILILTLDEPMGKAVDKVSD